MESLGTYLRQEREKKNKTLQNIASITKINIRYLKAIEEDNYDYIGEEVFVKGFLRAYADALGIDGEDVVRRYKESIQQKEVVPPSTSKSVSPEIRFFDISSTKEVLSWKDRLKRLSEKMKKRNILLMSLGIIIAIFILLSILNIVGVISPTSKMADQTTVNSGIEKEQQREPVTVPKDLTLIISAVEDTWIAATIDGVEKKDVLLKSGDRVVWTAKKDFVLTIGNAGGVNITFNGKEMGKLGKSGEVKRDLVISKDKPTDTTP